MGELKTYKIGSLEQGFPGMEDSKGRGQHPFAFTNLENVDFVPLTGLRLAKTPSRIITRSNPFSDVRRLMASTDGLIAVHTGFDLEVYNGGSFTFSNTNDLLGSILSERVLVGMRYVSGDVVATFVSDAGIVDSGHDPSFLTYSLGLTGSVGAGTIPAGTWYASGVLAKPVTVGSKTYYVRSVVGSQFISAASVALASPGILTVTNTSPVALFVTLTLLNSDERYDVGLMQPGQVLRLNRTPLGVGTLYGSNRESSVGAESVVSLHGRTWVTARANRTQIATINDTDNFSAQPPAPENVVYYSKINEPWSFPSENYFEVDGLLGRVTAMAVMGQQIAVFSGYGAAVISGNSSADFRVQLLPEVKPGPWDPNAVCSYAGIVYYVAQGGVFALQSNGAVTEISAPIRERFLDVGVLGNSIAVDPRSKKLWITIADSLSGATQAFVFDLRSGRWSRSTLSRATAMATGGLYSCYANVTDNHIYVFDDVSTTNVTGKMTLEFLDLGEAHVDRRPTKFRAEFDNPTATTATANLKYQNAAGAMVSVLIQSIPIGRSLKSWSLPASTLVGRGAKFELEVIGRSGVQVLAPISVDFRERRRRQA